MVRKLLRVFLKRLPREGFWHTFFEFGQWVWDHPLATACCSGVATMIWDWAGWDAVERVVAGLAVGLLIYGILRLVPPPIGGDGRVAMRRIKKTSLWRAEQIFNCFMRQDTRQFTDWAMYAFYSRLDPDRQVRFLEQNPGFKPYDTWQEISMKKLVELDNRERNS